MNSFSMTWTAKKKGTKTPNPSPISAQKDLAGLSPSTARDSRLRQAKKKIRAARPRSRRMVEAAISRKGKSPCRTAKNERNMEGRIRNRKTETSIRCIRPLPGCA